MPGAARLNDTVAGPTAGEHSGHTPPHSPEPFSGEISTEMLWRCLHQRPPGGDRGERSTAKETGAVEALKGGEPLESSVFINGKPAARMGDALAPHSGSGEITSGSGNVLIGG